MNVKKLINVAVLSVGMASIALLSGCKADSGDSNIAINNGMNALPVVDAGADQTVVEQTQGTVSGSATDSDGTINAASILWEVTDQNGVPDPSSTLIIHSPNQYSTTFTAPAVSSNTIVYLKLSVEDNDGGKGSDIVKVNVLDNAGNQPPIAVASTPNATVPTGTANVPLNSTGSKDNDGAIVGYLWEQTAGPDVGTITGADQATAYFDAPAQDASVTFKLTVTDNDQATGSASVTVTVQAPGSTNTPPDAVINKDNTVFNEGDTVPLKDGGSTDTDGSIVSYLWTQIAGPDAGVITNSDQPNASFTAPQVDASTDLTFELKVTDNGSASDTDTIVITINDVPAAPASCDTSFDPQTCANDFCGSIPEDTFGTQCAAFAATIVGCDLAADQQACLLDACNGTVGLLGEFCGPFESSTTPDPVAQVVDGCKAYAASPDQEAYCDQVGAALSSVQSTDVVQACKNYANSTDNPDTSGMFITDANCDYFAIVGGATEPPPTGGNPETQFVDACKTFANSPDQDAYCDQLGGALPTDNGAGGEPSVDMLVQSCYDYANDPASNPDPTMQLINQANCDAFGTLVGTASAP